MMAVYIIWQRQIKRYLRSRARMIGSLGQPLLFMVALGFGFGPVFQKAGEGSYLQFLVPGIIAMTVLFTAMFTGIETIWDRQFGFLKETLVAPVPRFKIMLGRTLGGATVATMQGVIVLLMSLAIGFRPANLFGIPISIVFMFLIALLFTALGTSIASILEDMQGFQLIMNFIVMPTFFLSGALFPLNEAPAALRAVAMADPLTYGVDGIRATITNSVQFGIGIDALILCIISFALLGLGSYLFSKVQV